MENLQQNGHVSAIEEQRLLIEKTLKVSLKKDENEYCFNKEAITYLYYENSMYFKKLGFLESKKDGYICFRKKV